MSRQHRRDGRDPGSDGDGADVLATDTPAPTAAFGVLGWLRWAWRQLTSMRVALLLLMLLAVAAVPGSVIPQRAQQPEKVARIVADHPGWGQLVDRLGFFNVFSSPWFAAIYLLLTVSLVGCILPRTRLHLRALLSKPPRVPRSLGRFADRESWTTTAEPETVAAAATAELRGRWPVRRYRVAVTTIPDGIEVSAERGYARESGNLVFHISLLLLLIAIAAGQLFHYRGQLVVVEGQTVADVRASYDSFEEGAWFDPATLPPFTIRLDQFTSVFDPETLNPRDFRAEVTVSDAEGSQRAETIRVNHPLSVDGASVYLQGNGFAPHLTVRDAAGEIAFSGDVPFLPQDTAYTSRGVVKVPDVSGGQPQIGLQGQLLPSAVQVGDKLWQSVSPVPANPVIVLAVWSGDLGLDDGVPQNAYQLTTAGLTQATDTDGSPVTLALRPGETVDLPDGLGTVTFDALPRFVALDLRHDPSVLWVLAAAVLALGGVAVSLFTPRRRLWLRVRRDQQGRTVVDAAALARGTDPGLAGALSQLVAAARQAADPEDA